MRTLKQSSIPVIIFSVIASLLLIVALACGVFLIARKVSAPSTVTPTPTPTQTQTPSESSPTPTITLTSETPTPTVNTPTPSPSETTEPTKPIIVEDPCMLKATGDAGLTYQDSITFLGDSTTYHMIINKVLSDGESTHQVWFGANGTLSLPFATTNDLFDTLGAPVSAGKTLETLAKEKKPQILVITLGAGVSPEFNEQKFKQAYNLVIDTVLAASPSTKIICNSIYPVCRTGSAIGNINNPDIKKANRWILECASDHYAAGKAVYYLDSFSVLVDIEGYLPDALSNGDGLHLTAAGYELILENLRKHKIP